MKAEKTITAAIIRCLRADGWLVWKNHGTQFSTTGLPDLMAVREGRFIAIEVKRPGGKTTPMQDWWIEQLRAQGVAAGVATSVDEAVEIAAEEP